MNPSYRKVYIIPTKHIRSIMEWGIKHGQNVHADELDCSKSFVRQYTKKTPREVLELGLKSKGTFWSFIHRDAICGDPEKWDLGCRTTGTKADYFLWIDLTPEQGQKLILEYNLEAK